MAVDTTRLRFGDLISGACALLLFIVMFFKWYGAKGPNGEKVPDAFKDLVSFNAWESFQFFDIILFLICAVVIGVVVVRLLNIQLPQLPVPLSTIVLGAGALAVLIILFRLIVTPDPSISAFGETAHVKDGGGEVTRSIGVFLGFLLSLGIAAGGFLSAQERGDAVPGVGGAGFGGAGGGPLGGGGGAPAQPQAAQPVAAQPAAAQPAAAQPVQQQAAAQPAASGPKADWYPDPQGQARLRYWDGTQWTDQTAD